MNKVTIGKLPGSKVEIKVEVPAEEFETFFQKALEQIAKDVEINGFRRGSAPKELVKSRVGDAKILDRAATMAIETTFPAAVAENNLEPLGYPEVQVLKLAPGNPFEYRAVVAVYPRVELPDYKQIAAGFKLEKTEVTEEDIKRMKMEKERHAREHSRQGALSAVAQKSTVEVPEVLVARETQKMMDQLKEKTPQMLDMSFEDYLKKLGKTEAELKDAMAKDNEIKIKNYLVLAEIAKAENIEVSDEEAIAAAKKEMSDNANAAVDEQAKEYWREALKNEKTFEKLESYFKK